MQHLAFRRTFYEHSVGRRMVDALDELEYRLLEHDGYPVGVEAGVEAVLESFTVAAFARNEASMEACAVALEALVSTV